MNLNQNSSQQGTNWVSKFLKEGTANGCGDLSIMVRTVSEILAQDRAEIRADERGKITRDFVSFLNSLEVYYGNPKAEKMAYYDDVIDFINKLNEPENESELVCDANGIEIVSECQHCFSITKTTLKSGQCGKCHGYKFKV